VASTGCVSVKFDVEDFYESLLRKSKFGQIGQKYWAVYMNICERCIFADDIKIKSLSLTEIISGC